MPYILLSTGYIVTYSTSKKSCPPRVDILQDFQFILKIWKILEHGALFQHSKNS